MGIGPLAARLPRPDAIKITLRRPLWTLRASQEEPMRDGFTRKLEVDEPDQSFDGFLTRWKVIVVVLSGDAAGTEHEMTQPTVSIGRGTDADWSFPDDTMSKEHAALEFTNSGIRLRDLGSRNGARVNGSDVKAADLKNGDRFQLGEYEFQFVLQKRARKPKTYVIREA
jgi:hypothetical protein